MTSSDTTGFTGLSIVDGIARVRLASDLGMPGRDERIHSRIPLTRRSG